MKPFELEVYLSKYEFNAPYLLCCSDAESVSMQEVIDNAPSQQKAMWNSLNLSYTEDKGLPALREVIATTLYPGLTADQILCFAGAGEGIYCALQVLCQAKDHAIVITPCYQSLLEMPSSIGCDVTSIELLEADEWRLDLQAIEQAIKPETKIIVMNFPHNPTGQVITQTDLEALVALCEQHDLWLFSDEVYRLLGNPEQGFAKPAATVYAKALSLGVMSKAFGMAGLRVGWIACQDQALLNKLLQFKHYLSICNSGPSEVLSLMALTQADKILARNNKIVAENLAELDEFINQSALFSWVKPQGGCVGFARYHGDESMEQFCKRLVEKTGVLLLPADVYQLNEPYVRFGFGRLNMSEALSRLKDFVRV